MSNPIEENARRKRYGRTANGQHRDTVRQSRHLRENRVSNQCQYSSTHYSTPLPLLGLFIYQEYTE